MRQFLEKLFLRGPDLQMFYHRGSSESAYSLDTLEINLHIFQIETSVFLIKLTTLSGG